MIKTLLTLVFLASCGKTVKVAELQYGKNRQPTQCHKAKELNDRGPIATKGPFTSVPVYSVTIDANQGDKVLLLNSVEVTNDVGYNVMMGRYIRAEVNGESYIVGEKAGLNVTPAMHHYTENYSIIDNARFSGEITYTYYVYFGSDAAKPGDFVIIEQCYGQLQAMNLTSGEFVE